MNRIHTDLAISPSHGLLSQAPLTMRTGAALGAFLDEITSTLASLETSQNPPAPAAQ